MPTPTSLAVDDGGTADAGPGGPAIGGTLQAVLTTYGRGEQWPLLPGTARIPLMLLGATLLVMVVQLTPPSVLR